MHVARFTFFNLSVSPSLASLDSRSCRCFATGSGEWVDADPAACDREEELDELIETVDATEMEIKDEEVESRLSRLVVERFSEKTFTVSELLLDS